MAQSKTSNLDNSMTESKNIRESTVNFLNEHGFDGVKCYDKFLVHCSDYYTSSALSFLGSHHKTKKHRENTPVKGSKQVEKTKWCGPELGPIIEAPSSITVPKNKPDTFDLDDYLAAQKDRRACVIKFLNEHGLDGVAYYDDCLVHCDDDNIACVLSLMDSSDCCGFA